MELPNTLFYMVQSPNLRRNQDNIFLLGIFTIYILHRMVQLPLLLILA